MKKNLYHVDPKGNVEWLGRGGDLSGAPEVVEEDFNCSFCNITSLEHGPKIVGGSYYCCGNRDLHSLKGVPDIIEGNFDCSSCDLLYLEKGPKEVKGLYNCRFNRNLKSLQGICNAQEYVLPEGFTLKDVEKELRKQELFKGMSGEEADLLDALF